MMMEQINTGKSKPKILIIIYLYYQLLKPFFIFNHYKPSTYHIIYILYIHSQSKSNYIHFYHFIHLFHYQYIHSSHSNKYYPLLYLSLLHFIE